MKFLRIAFGIVLMGSAAYFLLGKENISRYSFPVIDAGRKAGATLIQQFNVPQTHRVTAGVSQLRESAVRKGEGLISGIAEKIKLETFKTIKESIEQKVDDIGQSFGVNVAQVNPGDDIPVTFGVKAGNPAYFSIENREGNDITYEVDWQDGRKDSGTLQKGKSVTISHAWIKSGGYKAAFKILSPDREKNYYISINIK